MELLELKRKVGAHVDILPYYSAGEAWLICALADAETIVLLVPIIIYQLKV